MNFEDFDFEREEEEEEEEIISTTILTKNICSSTLRSVKSQASLTSEEDQDEELNYLNERSTSSINSLSSS